MKNKKCPRCIKCKHWSDNRELYEGGGKVTKSVLGIDIKSGQFVSCCTTEVNWLTISAWNCHKHLGLCPEQRVRDTHRENNRKGCLDLATLWWQQ